MVATIEYIENVVATLEKAAEANRNTPGREGNVIVLTPELADQVMITGDLHGHRRNFNFIRRIAALDKHPRRHLILQEVCHGGPTYPQNGGCMSHTMLEDVAKLKTQFPTQVHFLLGNHELAELTDYPIQKKREMLNLKFRLGMQQMYGPATDRVRECYNPFIRTLPLAIRLPGDVFICHSVPEDADTRRFKASIFSRELDDDDFFGRGDLFRMLWGRDYRPENVRAFAEAIGARVIINGHEPCPDDGFKAPNDHQIILDCCGDPATYVILPTDREFTHAEIVQRIQKLK